MYLFQRFYTDEKTVCIKKGIKVELKRCILCQKVTLKQKNFVPKYNGEDIFKFKLNIFLLFYVTRCLVALYHK